MTDTTRLREGLHNATERLRQTNLRIREFEARSREPIAIIGMSCRFPGGATSPDLLWRLVDAGVDTITPFPDERGWERGLLTNELANAFSDIPQGGFVESAGDFDAEFFEISPREAATIDPQQRLLLHLAWECLEHAGVDAAALRGSDAGVFTGISSQDHAAFVQSAWQRAEGSSDDDFADFSLTSSIASVASGRVAYTLNLQGPALTTDTACSSSLVAIHQACQALRSQECSIAFAGGATIMSTPSVFMAFARQGGLAPDGRAKSFAAAADGAAFSEGGGLLLLERLSDAQRNGRTVFAVIRGSAVNQDGATNGLSAPNGPSQERVIARALAQAGLHARDVDLIEAHGTGTTLGDPIEAQALLNTYGRRGGARAARVGSIKSNIGHPQAAAGVAGVIKSVMALRHGTMPKTLHVDEPTPMVDWAAGGLELLTSAEAWPSGDRPRRAGVSSFGVSGTNAHLILEERPRDERLSESAERDGPARATSIAALPISAKGRGALRAQAARLASHLRRHQNLDPHDIAFTLATRRTCLRDRAVVIGANPADLLERLERLSQGDPSRGLIVGTASRGGRLAVLFPGQGAQRAQMGQGLYQELPAFAAAFDEVCDVFDRLLGVSLADILKAPAGSKGAAQLDHTSITQPALFALEVALYRLITAFGLQPQYVVGHSVGELAAAHVSGLMSLDDACRLVAARATLIGALPRGGAMGAIEASEGEVETSLIPYANRVVIAAVNAPLATVISGDDDGVDAVLAQWRRLGRQVRRLEVSHAFHSPHVDGICDELTDVARQLTFSDMRVPIVSTLTGRLLTAEEARSPEYWVRQARHAVRFADAVRSLQSHGATHFAELGPDATLTAAASECMSDANVETSSAATLVPLLRRGQAETESVITAIAELHAHGLDVDWSPLHPPTSKAASLPTYAFQNRRYWRPPTNATSPQPDEAPHPILTSGVPRADGGGWLFTGCVSLQTHPWIGDHLALGHALVPGTAYLEMALSAGRHLGYSLIEDLTLEAPLVLTEAETVRIQLTVTEADERDRREVRIYSRSDSRTPGHVSETPWTEHASGVLGPCPADHDEAVETTMAQAWPPTGAESIDVANIYERIEGFGFAYGPAFRGLRAAWRLGDALFAEVSLDSDLEPGQAPFGIHPALLDSALQLGGADAVQDGTQLRVLFSWREARLHRGGARALRVRLTPADNGGVSATATTETGHLVFTAAAVTARSTTRRHLDGSIRGTENDLLLVEWVDAVPGRDRPTFATLGAGGSATSLAALASQHHEDVADLRATIEADGTTPDFVIASLPAPNDSHAPASVRAAIEWTRRLTQTWAASKALAGVPLVIATERAIALSSEEHPSPAAAATWGFVRSIQSEHPGQFLVVDADGDDASTTAIAHGIGIDGETQLAVRGGRVLIPRFKRALARPVPAQPPLDTTGTVLVTGGTGALGALVARHLVTTHSVRHLLLTSRTGNAAARARDLKAELTRHGATVDISACDVADQAQLEKTLSEIPGDRPLTAVFHLAGQIEDGVLETLDENQTDRVLRPKLDGAWNLHNLTSTSSLSRFICFTSAAGLLGPPGQALYSAANAAVDALMTVRRAGGLPANALAWGPWDIPDGVGGRAATTRALRAGIVPMSPSHALALLDHALNLDSAVAAPLRIEARAIDQWTAEAAVPPLMRDLGRTPQRPPADSQQSLESILATAPEAEWDSVLEAAVRAETANVLGYGSGDDIDPHTAFKELGLDSLGAVQLRNRLGRTTGRLMPATLVFDHPTPAAIACYLRTEIRPLRARARRGRVRQQSEEPIAIVGTACRFPGGVSSAHDLWNLVINGEDAIAPFPGDRGWPLDQLYDADPSRRGCSYTRHGGFLAEATAFDPAFFGISPKEALAMDPQQRLLLELAWESAENAGINPHTLRGSDTGVFVGVAAQDYLPAGRAPSDVEGYCLTGGSSSVASGRIAYVLGLEGPALSIDTACSASLVAISLASRALRAGECSMAMAGGATVLSSPALFVEFSRQRALSADGRCKAFAASADGTGFAEGGGLLVLERLSDAQRLGHRVLAVVRGSAVNQDGASNGLTAPNGPAQERVIEQALASAGLVGADVDAVEAHGTGTPLGDPIEANALLATYGRERVDGPLRIGSIKSNLGHTSCAAGVAGVIKMVMAMRHGMLPKTLHVDAVTPMVDWDAGAVEVLREPIAWPAGERVRRAGISSFGVSGTNAHLILEEPPTAAAAAFRAASSEADRPAGGQKPPGPIDWDRDDAPFPLVLTGRSPQALARQADLLEAYLDEHAAVELPDVAHTLATGRAAFQNRAVVLSRDREALSTGLSALKSGRPSSLVTSGRAHRDPKVAFVFPGQGSQWLGMAAQLAETSPAFAAGIRACDAALSAHIAWSVEETLQSADAAWLSDVAIVQPALFAVMVSLARLWRACGVEPACVIGHSQGEIAAAHVAGGLSLEDAAVIVTSRARALVNLVGRGEMLAVGCSKVELQPLLDAVGGDAVIAAENGPRSIVVSGGSDVIDALNAALQRRGIETQTIPVGYASHGPQVEPLRDSLIDALKGIRPRSSTIPMCSTVTGELIDTATMGPDYWYRNLREPVRLAPAVAQLTNAGYRVFMEVSPHPGLSAGLQETAEDLGVDDAHFIGTLRRNQGGLEQFAVSLAHASCSGAPVDWGAILRGAGGRTVELPTYPFDRRRFWIGSGAIGDEPALLGQTNTGHPLLGAKVDLPEGRGTVFTGRLAMSAQPWLADHTLIGAIVLPGAVLAEMAIAAGKAIGFGAVQDLVLEAALQLPDEGSLTIRLSVTGDRDAPDFEIHTTADGVAGWTRHASGTLGPDPGSLAEDPQAWANDEGSPDGAITTLYDRAAAAGFDYGPSFRLLRSVRRKQDEILAEAELDQASEGSGFTLHPALLDAALQTLLFDERASEIQQKPRVPFAWTGISLAETRTTSARIRIRRMNDDAVRIAIYDGQGAPVASVDSVTLREITSEQVADARRSSRDSLFELIWSPRELPTVDERGAWTVNAPAGLNAAACSFPKIADLRAALDSGTTPPEVVVAFAPDTGEGPLSRPQHAPATWALELIKSWLSDARLGQTQLTLATRRAVAATTGDQVDPAAAAMWGLVRSAQAENPGRLVLVDLDCEPSSSIAAVTAALSLDEPQVAVRAAKAYLPRLRRPTSTPQRHDVTPWSKDGTVLITGGTGHIGGLIAQHLVSQHGVRHLVLTSRRGSRATIADELKATLTADGAEVRIEQCDVADRAQLEQLLDRIPAQHGLSGVVHAAGVMDDATIEAITPERMLKVLAAKADAAWHLHQLTAQHDLTHFVLCSSVAGTVGSAGQGSYAAANAFLDGLAVLRAHHGLTATAVAWGLWNRANGMTTGLGTSAAERLKRSGIVELTDGQGIDLLNSGLQLRRPVVIAAAFDRAVLHRRAEHNAVPPVLSSLVRRSAPSTPQRSLEVRLRSLSERRQRALVLNLIRETAAAVLGHASSSAVDSDRTFKELGFDSLAAVEFRNLLRATTDLMLPPTMVFDYPTPAALAEHVWMAVTRPTAERAGDSATPDSTSDSAIDDLPVGRLVAMASETSDVGDGGQGTPER